MCGRPSGPPPCLRTKPCCTRPLAAVPATPTTLRAYTCSLGWQVLSLPPYLAQSLAQADLAPVPLPVSETLPRPQTGLFGKGRAFPFCLGFSPCLSVCGGGVGPLVGLKAFSQRHGAGRTHWNTGQAEGWEFSSPAPACLGL